MRCRKYWRAAMVGWRDGGVKPTQRRTDVLDHHLDSCVFFNEGK